MTRDLRDVLDTLVADLRAERVVSLTRIQRITRVAEQMGSEDPAQALLGALDAAFEESTMAFEGLLMDHVERLARDQPGASVEDVAWYVARSTAFRRVNRVLRGIRGSLVTRESGAGPVQVVEIPAHTRSGRPVAFHTRYVGQGHLEGIVTTGRPEIVRDVLRCIIDGQHHRR